MLVSKISKKLYILPRNELKTKQNNKQTKYDDNDCPALNVFLLKLKVSIENEATILRMPFRFSGTICLVY